MFTHSLKKNASAADKFKKTFIQEMHFFKEKVDCLSAGDSNYANGWRDTFILGGSTVGAAGVGTVVAVLATMSILSVGASAGISIAAVVVGLIAAESYNYYRARKKRHEYKHAASILAQDDIFDHIDDMSDILAKLFANQLDNCTELDASLFATACFSAISHEMQKDKYLQFKELLDPVKLQAIMLKSTKYIKDAKLTMSGLENKIYHSVGIIKHAALYCKETHSIYSCRASKPNKYGVLFFETKEELEDYRILVARQKKDSKKWHFEKVHPAKASELRRSMFFKMHGNDDQFLNTDRDEVVAKKDAPRLS